MWIWTHLSFNHMNWYLQINTWLPVKNVAAASPVRIWMCSTVICEGPCILVDHQNTLKTSSQRCHYGRLGTLACLSHLAWLLFTPLTVHFDAKFSSFELANLSMCSTFCSVALPLCYLDLFQFILSVRWLPWVKSSPPRCVHQGSGILFFH